MSSKRISTFRQGDTLLVGIEARKTWAAQSAKCNCGSYGDTENAISGECQNMRAEWLGCPNCSGQALGHPLVYRTQSQINFARKYTQ